MPALLPAVGVEALFASSTAALSAAEIAAAAQAAAAAAQTAAATTAATTAAAAAAPAVEAAAATLPGVVAGGTGTMAGTLAGAAPEAAGILSAAPTAAGSTAATTAGTTAGNAEILQGLDAAKFDAVTGQAGVPQNAYVYNSPASTPSVAAPTSVSAAPPAPPPYVPTPAAPVEASGVMPQTAAPVDTPFTQAPPEIFTGPVKSTATAMERGGQSAFKLIGKMTDFVRENPLTSLGSVMTAQKLGIFGGNDDKSSEDEYERTPYSGLSPKFQPGGPSPYLYGFADGGITGGGPVEQMSNMNAIGGNEMYPMANIPRLEYANPVQQRPVSENIMTMGGDAPTDPYTGQLKFSDGGYAEEKEAAKTSAMRKRYSKMMGDNSNMEENISDMKSAVARAQSKSGIVGHGISNLSKTAGDAAQSELADLMGKYKIKSSLPKMLSPQSGSMEYAANGGIMHGLGGYSDGGRLLKGPGDGVSDSIPAVIGSKQPARLADGEFVIPARIVSELGNGSTEAGARQLYAMMERIQKGRKKSVGKGKVAVDSKAKKHLPA